MGTKNFTLFDDEGDEFEVELPSKMEVCHRCEGHGTILNPSIGEHAYSSEEFNESFDDEEKEEYFRRGGRYDITCPTCSGNKVVEVIDDEACEKNPTFKKNAKLVYEKEEADFAYDEQCRHEERMGY